MTGSCTKKEVKTVKQMFQSVKTKMELGGGGGWGVGSSVQLKVQSSHRWVTSAVCDGDVLVIVAQEEGVSE